MAKGKTFCGSGKKIDFNGGGFKIKLSFSASDLATMREHLNDKGWVQVEVVSRREISDKGVTHYCAIDDWTPNTQAEHNTPICNNDANDKADHLPF